MEECNDAKKTQKDDETGTISISYKGLFKVGFVLITLIVIIMLFKNFNYAGAISNSNVNTNAVAVQSDSVQIGTVQLAKMRVVNGEYVIEPNSFKVNQKVRIEADISKMPGCSKSVVISAFNVRKNLNENNNIIEFTPNKAGTFNIACSMNMYKGTFSVLQSDGTKTNYVEKASASGATCGGSSGGCGCGG